MANLLSRRGFSAMLADELDDAAGALLFVMTQAAENDVASASVDSVAPAATCTDSRKGCRAASSGVMRCSGSHTMHFSMKSRNVASVHPMATDNGRDPGLRVRPC